MLPLYAPDRAYVVSGNSRVSSEGPRISPTCEGFANFLFFSGEDEAFSDDIITSIDC